MKKTANTTATNTATATTPASASTSTQAKAIMRAFGNGNDLVYMYTDSTYSDGKNHAITTRASGKCYIVVNGLTYSEREKQADGSFAPARKGANGVTHKNKTKHYDEGVLQTEAGCAYTFMSDFEMLFSRMIEHTADNERVSKAFFRAFKAFVDKTEREALVSEYEAERAEAEARARAEAEAEAQATRERAKAAIARQLVACGLSKAQAEAQAEAMVASTQATQATTEAEAQA